MTQWEKIQILRKTLVLSRTQRRMKIIKSTASACFGLPILGRSRSISWLKSYSNEYISPPSSYYGTLISDFCRFDSSEGALNNKASSSVSDSPSTLQLKSMGLYSLSKTVSFPSTKSYACNSNTDSESTELVDSSSYNQPLPLKSSSGGLTLCEFVWEIKRYCSFFSSSIPFVVHKEIVFLLSVWQPRMSCFDSALQVGLRSWQCWSVISALRVLEKNHECLSYSDPSSLIS
ncbi:hypothetical protein O6H91_13G041700 [Diphasiastrum complanatum]|uniref:Uncharacterized protein n=1 Tax=Diphasiastrum complanatum TaxID=34168 RepID=A0ACC2BU61_DIPCM|nr:hypothetical protein O6H91_13G041700 [Diphasiastrum complanatum]